jgi:hypothetical protein
MVISASHHPYDMPPLGRQAPWIACAAIPATATAIAVGRRRRRATCSAPIVAGGVAAGDSVTSTVNTAVLATGRHSIIAVSSQLSAPTAMSSASSGPGGRPLHDATIVTAISTPDALRIAATAAMPGRRSQSSGPWEGLVTQ